MSNRLTIRISPQTYDVLRHKAAEEHRTMTNYVTHWLDRHLNPAPPVVSLTPPVVNLPLEAPQFFPDLTEAQEAEVADFARRHFGKPLADCTPEEREKAKNWM